MRKWPFFFLAGLLPLNGQATRVAPPPPPPRCKIFQNVLPPAKPNKPSQRIPLPGQAAIPAAPSSFQSFPHLRLQSVERGPVLTALNTVERRRGLQYRVIAQVADPAAFLAEIQVHLLEAGKLKNLRLRDNLALLSDQAKRGNFRVFQLVSETKAGQRVPLTPNSFASKGSVYLSASAPLRVMVHEIDHAAEFFRNPKESALRLERLAARAERASGEPARLIHLAYPRTEDLFRPGEALEQLSNMLNFFGDQTMGLNVGRPGTTAEQNFWRQDEKNWPTPRDESEAFQLSIIKESRAEIQLLKARALPPLTRLMQLAERLKQKRVPVEDLHLLLDFDGSPAASERLFNYLGLDYRYDVRQGTLVFEELRDLFRQAREAARQK